MRAPGSELLTASYAPPLAATAAILCRVCPQPELPPPARVEPRSLAPAPSGLLIGPTAQSVKACPIGGGLGPNTHGAVPGRSLREGAGLLSQALSDLAGPKHQTEALNPVFLTRQILFRKKGGEEESDSSFKPTS